MKGEKMESLYPVSVTENEFFSDLARAKVIVDNGIKDYFILLDPTCFQDVKMIGNTTLKDCVDIFGLGYVTLFRFAGHFNCKSKDKREEYQSFCIRPITKSDKAKLRGSIRFFPSNTWVADWRDGTGVGLLLPFVQDEKTAKIKWLSYEKAFNTEYQGGKIDEEAAIPAPCIYLKRFIEVLPDYFDCNLAIVKYKGVDMAIPVAPGTAKTTFKNRERDESGVKRRIVHNVRAHSRVNSENGVERHLRGRSEIEMRGEQITISAPLEWSDEIHIRKALARQARK